ncbi:MAG: hypothetical protein ACREPU_05580 [Rhodanobacteraceae bacterium]
MFAAAVAEGAVPAWAGGVIAVDPAVGEALEFDEVAGEGGGGDDPEQAASPANPDESTQPKRIDLRIVDDMAAPGMA